MAPRQRKKTIPIQKPVDDEDIPPPPPNPPKDDTSDYDSGSESDVESDISEATPPPPVPPKAPPPVVTGGGLRQQTLVSSYAGTYKATILRLIREDPDIRGALAGVGLGLGGGGDTHQNIVYSPLPDIRTTILGLLRHDTEIRAVLGEIIASSAAPSKPRSRAKSGGGGGDPVPDPPLTFEKRTMAYLRNNIQTAFTYEAFTEQATIEDEDLEVILERGFVEGFAALILRNLGCLEQTQRPVVSFARDYSAVYVKVGSTKWKRDGVIPGVMGGEELKWDNMREIVFDFAQKVDIRVAELGGVDAPDGWSADAWRDRVDRIRKQASGGIDRIRLIDDICRLVAEGMFLEV